MLDRFRLDGEVAVVTGAARGIGRATARALCEAGAEAILSDMDLSASQDAAKGLKVGGLKATAMALDVTDFSATERAASEIVRSHDRVDVLVNNAEM